MTLLELTLETAINEAGEFKDVRLSKEDAEYVLSMLKEQDNLKQKMWNALYAEEDKLEKKFVGTEELHDKWFYVYRPWLQRGFEIAIEVISEQDWI